MWDEIKQEQLNNLQRLKLENALTESEKETLEQLFLELEQEEWQALKPSLERLRDEQIELQQHLSQTQTQNAILKAIAARQEDLLERAKFQLKALQNEHAELKNERERVLGKLAA